MDDSIRHDQPGHLRTAAARLCIIGMLGVPALLSAGGALLGRPSAADTEENRHLATLPAWPVTAQAWFEAPAKLTAWVNDHFGLRKKLVKLNNRVRFRLFNEFSTMQMVAGEHGRYFLGSHSATGKPFEAMTVTCGRLFDAAADKPQYISTMLRQYDQAGLHPRLLIIPSAPVVHGDETPAWMRAECMATDTPVTRMLRHLHADTARAVYYPLAEMRAIKQKEELFPRLWFHWTGPGLDQVTRLSISHFWQRPLDASPPLQTVSYDAHSDLPHLFMGMNLQNRITRPNPGATGVKDCLGEHCYPEIDDIARMLKDVSRYHNPKAPPRRLLIISDSFGSRISAWYARYYRDVEQFATNTVPFLRPDQAARLRAYLYRDPANTDILLLYHDAGVLTGTFNGGTAALLPEPPRVDSAQAQVQSQAQ